MFVFIACDPGRSAAPPAQVEATPVSVEPNDADTIPCGPRRVLQEICQQCHQKPPVNGAPFPLVTRSNIVRVGPDGEIRRLMIEQLEVGRMPLAPVTIDYNSREILLDWLHAGAPAEPRQSCEEDPSRDAGADTPDAAAPSGDAADDEDSGTDDAADASASD